MRRMRARSSSPSVLLAVLVAACGSPNVVVIDASVEPPDAGWVRSPPMLPEPTMEPHAVCPTGFGVVALDGATACEPWAGGARPTCARGERLAAGLGCVPLATDCGADVPPEVASGALLVREGSTGGDGSVERPFGTIADAIAVGGSSLALAPGRYDAPPVLDGLTIVGTCPDRTTLVLPGPTTVAHGELRRLALTGPGVLTVSRAGELTLRAIEVTALAGGLRVDGTLEIHGGALHDLATDAIVTSEADRLVLEDVAIEHVRGVALSVVDRFAPHTHVGLQRVVIADVSPPPVATGSLGAAVLVDGGGTVSVDGLVIEDATGHAMVSFADDTSLANLVLRRLAGAGLLQDDASPDEVSGTVDSIWIDDAGGGIVFSHGKHTATDVVIEGVRYVGLAIVDGDTTVERALIDGAVGLGIDATSCTAMLRHVHVRNVVHATTVEAGNGGGLLVEPSATVTLEHTVFEQVEHAGIAVANTGAGVDDSPATLIASDVAIHDVQAVGPSDGMGVLAVDGGQATLRRASIRNVCTAGLAAQDGSVNASNLTIDHVEACRGGPDGIGAVASQFDPTRATTMTLDRVAIADVQRWGVIATGPGTRLDASSLLVERVRAVTDGDVGGGGAIVVHDGATVVVRRFEARDSEWAGIIVTFDVTATFELGIVHDNGVAIVQSPVLLLNMGVSPGLDLLGVDLLGLRVPTETTIQRPMLAP